MRGVSGIVVPAWSGHAHEDGGALPRFRLDLQRRADERRALLHPQQPEPLFGCPGPFLIESHAIVLDDEEDVIGTPLEDDLHVPARECLATLVSASCAMR